jgi:hypothetical protein
MKAQVHLRPAQFEDLFEEISPRINKIYFEKSAINEIIYGPYLLGDYSVDWFRSKNDDDKNLLFVPSFHKVENCLTISKDLIVARLEDISAAEKQIKMNLSYFVLENDGFTGPYLISENTNKNNLYSLYLRDKVFIFDTNLARGAGLKFLNYAS